MNEQRKSYKRQWMQGARALQKQKVLGSVPVEDESPEACFHYDTQSCMASSASSTNYESHIAVEQISNMENNASLGPALENGSEWDLIDQHVVIDSDSEEEFYNADCKPSLCENLINWVNENNISHNATDQLLKILKSYGMTELPATARSLLKTKRNIELLTKAGMEYFYFGFERGILNTLQKYPDNALENMNQISVSFNIDGLPLFKSTKTSLWPILCGLHVESFAVEVFPVALCLGGHKPENLKFMNEFIEELRSLVQHGFLFQGRNMGINICSFICDAPAKAMVKGIKLYSGYYGCDKCSQTGVWVGRMTYQEIDNIVLRTDVTFRNQCQVEHHHQITPLTNLPIDMIKTFPVDYMHQVCLGVMKRLLLLWLKGKLRDFKISARQKDEISTKLIQLRKSIPALFAGKPRSLDDVDRWKATEYRQFLLYTGKIVLKNVLRPDFYSHFMALSVAICILISPQLSKTHLAYAKNLLKFFVTQGRILYGEEFLVYNVHSLMHIADDVSDHLDSFSAFPYENYMQKVKKMVHSGQKPTYSNCKENI